MVYWNIEDIERQYPRPGYRYDMIMDGINWMYLRDTPHRQVFFREEEFIIYTDIFSEPT